MERRSFEDTARNPDGFDGPSVLVGDKAAALGDRLPRCGSGDDAIAVINKAVLAQS